MRSVKSDVQFPILCNLYVYASSIKDFISSVYSYQIIVVTTVLLVINRDPFLGLVVWFFRSVLTMYLKHVIRKYSSKDLTCMKKIQFLCPLIAVISDLFTVTYVQWRISTLVMPLMRNRCLSTYWKALFSDRFLRYLLQFSVLISFNFLNFAACNMPKIEDWLSVWGAKINTDVINGSTTVNTKINDIRSKFLFYVRILYGSYSGVLSRALCCTPYFYLMFYPAIPTIYAMNPSHLVYGSLIIKTVLTLSLVYCTEQVLSRMQALGVSATPVNEQHLLQQLQQYVWSIVKIYRSDASQRFVLYVSYLNSFHVFVLITVKYMFEKQISNITNISEAYKYWGTKTVITFLSIPLLTLLKMYIDHRVENNEERKDELLFNSYFQITMFSVIGFLTIILFNSYNLIGGGLAFVMFDFFNTIRGIYIRNYLRTITTPETYDYVSTTELIFDGVSPFVSYIFTTFAVPREIYLLNGYGAIILAMYYLTLLKHLFGRKIKK